MLTAKFQSVEKNKEAIGTIEQSAKADRPVMGRPEESETPSGNICVNCK